MKTSPRAAAFAAALLLAAAPALPNAADAAASSRELDGALRAIVGAAPLSGARTSILVADVESGQVLFAKDPDVLLNPASNVKLFTTAAALARLGPEYRFSTEFYVDAASRGSSAVKTLYLKGRGDPTILTERLWAIAGDLVHLGLRRVGEIAVDESFFDGEREGPGFDQETGDKSYLAPAGAASLNWNTVEVVIAPGERRGARARVELEPASDYFEIDDRATTVASNGRRRVVVSSVVHGGKQRIVVEGRIPAGSRPQSVWRKIDQPGLYLGHTLAKLLQLRGLQLGARVRLAEVPQGAPLVHVAESESLAEIVRRLNKTSNNFVAEQILKTLGAEGKGAPGTWPKGVAAVEDFLADAGIPRGSYLMKNGSGLNDANRFSARQLVTVLRTMWSRFRLQPEYVGSLPVAGRDGTIRYRMEGTEAEGRLRAKTGTLVAGAVTSLSGYVETAGRRTLAFAVLVNDYPGRPSAVVRSVDAIGAALAASGGAPGTLGAAIAAAHAPPAAGPEASPADLASALRTYYALGRAGDPRNVQVLRTALRSETEPALRVAIAECVYLSDPDGETSARTFLEAIPSDPRILLRLWTAGADEDPRPVLASLGDLAGEGTPDAVARLVDLAPASALDGGLADAIGDVLAGVAASAPDELVAALRAAPAATQEAAVRDLGLGLARSDEKDHPFLPALKALGQKDGDEGAFARALEPRVADALKASVAARAAPAMSPAGATVPASAAGAR